MARRKAAESVRKDVPQTTSTATSPVAPSISSTLKRRPGTVRAMSENDIHLTTEEALTSTPASWTSRNQWVVLAVASGACAAFNGVFAKLTTNDLTSNLSQALAKAFGLTAFESIIELVVRCMFFGLNLVFNGVMWTLFTKALARGSSTTQVSIMNTSSNFMITAILGLVIFSESLPPLWWLGAAMLVAGNVIIGRKEESGTATDDVAVSVVEPRASNPVYGTVALPEGLLPIEKDDDDEDVALLGNLDESES
ncbi:hypothetical protein BJ170DRAFT_680566 [Xylariales sp. AK1849]|nr:hypothetical protein BJ170DRAFT_680566 [Xylariales sp. AK1849]